MIVPEFWAEARIQKRVNERQITVRRYGWSDISLEEAQANADERAQEAFARIAAGEKLPRREPKVSYNGAEGVPIREEIVGRYGNAVITRNIYGARCLNTPDVFFADVDIVKSVPARLTCMVYLLLLVGTLVFCFTRNLWIERLQACVVALFLGKGIAYLLHRGYELMLGGPERRAFHRIKRFARDHAAWHLRLYRTPAGFRVLAMHQTFDPADASTNACFTALGTDPVYVRMCMNQRCFRARVSPKPWRVGISQHIRPRPGIWPINPERLPGRWQWVNAYEAKAQGYASCRFIESLGSSTVHPDAQAVQIVHDELCRAGTDLPLA